MAARRKNSVAPKRIVKNSCAAQSLYEMVLSPVAILTRNLGIQTVVNVISKNEKFRKKKYMGVLRWESSSVSVMMVRFPVTLSMYVRKRSTKMTTCSCRSSVNPRRMNTVTTVWFFIAKFWLPKIGKENQKWRKKIWTR